MASTSFHLSSAEAQSADLKTMTTSVDRLFGDMTIDSFHQATAQEQKSLKNAAQSVPGIGSASGVEKFSQNGFKSQSGQGASSKVHSAYSNNNNSQSFDSTRNSVVRVCRFSFLQLVKSLLKQPVNRSSINLWLRPFTYKLEK